MFGVGMNNNGTGLVFDAQALADHRPVLLPIILYNLEQQLVAGIATTLLLRSTKKMPTKASPLVFLRLGRLPSKKVDLLGEFVSRITTIVPFLGCRV
jgi:hypothetical protein